MDLIEITLFLYVTGIQAEPLVSRTWVENGNFVGKCHPGSSYLTPLAADPADCALKCAKDHTRCKSANFNSGSKLCKLFETDAGSSLQPCPQETYLDVVIDPEDPPPPSNGTCDSNWGIFNDFCYKYSPVKMRFDYAQAHCASLGANLASVHSYHENRFVASLAPYNDEVLIGITKQSGRRMDTQYVWTDGSAVDYFSWFSGEPDRNPEPAYCVRILKHSRDKWGDFNCYEPAGFVCKKPAALSM